MNQQEITGALVNGGRYRATGYGVEVTDPAGAVTQEVDRNDIKEVRRKGRAVTIRRRKGKDIVLETATLDDAGRLEGALRGPAAAAVAAQPAKKGGGIGRKFLIGCGGLIALGVVIAVIASAADGGSKDSDNKEATASGGTTSAPAAPRANEARLAEGESTTAEGLTITLLQIRDPFVSPNQFSRPSAGNRHVAFKVQIENVGNRNMSANAFSFKLVDAENFQHQAESIVFAEQSLLGQAQSLGGGAKIEGWVGFQVKEGVALKELTYDPNPFTETDHRFRAP